MPKKWFQITHINHRRWVQFVRYIDTIRDAFGQGVHHGGISCLKRWIIIIWRIRMLIYVRYFHVIWKEIENYFKIKGEKDAWLVILKSKRNFVFLKFNNRRANSSQKSALTNHRKRIPPGCPSCCPTVRKVEKINAGQAIVPRSCWHFAWWSWGRENREMAAAPPELYISAHRQALVKRHYPLQPLTMKCQLSVLVKVQPQTHNCRLAFPRKKTSDGRWGHSPSASSFGKLTRRFLLSSNCWVECPGMAWKRRIGREKLKDLKLSDLLSKNLVISFITEADNIILLQ